METLIKINTCNTSICKHWMCKCSRGAKNIIEVINLKPKFEYVIKVDKEDVWRGLNPKEVYKELKKQNPNKRVSIAWRTTEDVLVCLQK